MNIVPHYKQREVEKVFIVVEGCVDYYVISDFVSQPDYLPSTIRYMNKNTGKFDYERKIDLLSLCGKEPEEPGSEYRFGSKQEAVACYGSFYPKEVKTFA